MNAEALSAKLAEIARAAHRTNLGRLQELESLLGPDSGADSGADLGPEDDRRSRAADVAHKLAGSAGTFGYTAVTETAKQLELQLLDPQPDQSRIRQLLGDVRTGLKAPPDDLD